MNVKPVVSIKPMRLSDDRTDFFVSIRVGDREVTPHVFREEYKSAYHLALYDWLLNGVGEEPRPVDFGPGDWPARVMPKEPATYAVVSYMSDGSTSCRGCTMDQWGSSFDLHVTEDPKDAAIHIATYRFGNENRREPIDTGLFEVHLLINGRNEEHALASDFPLVEEVERLVGECMGRLRESKFAAEARKIELDQQQQRDDRARAEQRRRDLYDELKKEFEP